MDDLKRKIKLVTPEEKHLEIDHIFTEWMAGLKVHTIHDKESGERANKLDPERASAEEKESAVGKDVEDKRYKAEEEGKVGMEKFSLKDQIEELKKQIERFKQKMKTYKKGGTSNTDLALGEVKEEIGRVREGILKVKLNFTTPEESESGTGDSELIKKLDEVKQFLEKLK